MKKRIESLKEFHAERRRVKARIAELEGLIQQDVQLLKESVKPMRLAANTVKNMFASDHDGVLGETIGLTVDRLIRKVLLRRTNFIVKFFVVLLMKNLTRNLVLKNSSNIMDWLKKQVTKFSSNHHDEKEYSSGWSKN